MGRSPCCSKVGLHRGLWTAREDALLTKYIQDHGEGQWRSLPKNAGLLRCGKSCRLRWMNYLRPDIKRGNITPDEDDLIIRMHALLGNRWSLIAGRLPGRTDNEIKNYWHTRLSRKLRSKGIDPNTHKTLPRPDPLVLIQTTTKRRRSNRKIIKVSSTNNEKNNEEEVEKIKVHNPKPLRFPSSSFFYMKTNYSNAKIPEVVDHDQWSNYIINDDQGVNNILIQGNSSITNEENDDLGSDDVAQAFNYSSLDKLYEEYLQLLKTEENENISFAESLIYNGKDEGF